MPLVEMPLSLQRNVSHQKNKRRKVKKLKEKKQKMFFSDNTNFLETQSVLLGAHDYQNDRSQQRDIESGITSKGTCGAHDDVLFVRASR